MRIHQIAEWAAYFYIYCFFGWIWESCYVSVRQRKLVNRGFMKGPLLPIYGSGAVCILFVTLPVRGNYVLMALIGMGASTVLEYLTGAAMEAIFKVRYWDYSTEFMNLNGHVCLKSTLCWGVMTFLVVYLVHPPVARAVAAVPGNIRYMLVSCVTALAAADFATSFKAAIDFRDALEKAEMLRRELREIQQRLDELEAQVAEGTARKKDELVDGLFRMGERGLEMAQGLREKGAEVWAQYGGKLSGKREQEKAAGGEEQRRLEWQELLLGKRIRLEKLQSVYSKSIHGLLKRNPGVVSKKYTEALEVVKGSIRGYLEARKEKKKAE